MTRAAIAILLALGACAASANTRSWDFRVLLDGSEIGEHRYELREEGESRALRSTAQYRVRLLVIDAFRYRHEASERWRGDCLESLASQTDTNGERDERQRQPACHATRLHRPAGPRSARAQPTGRRAFNPARRPAAQGKRFGLR